MFLQEICDPYWHLSNDPFLYRMLVVHVGLHNRAWYVNVRKRDPKYLYAYFPE